MCDYISRQEVIETIHKTIYEIFGYQDGKVFTDTDELLLMVNKLLCKKIREIPAADVVESEQRWIPCSERLPEDIRPVIVTWKNTDPASYYQYIVGKHYTGTACYKNGKWYWYSSTTEDILSEYGRYDSEEFDEAIECIAWMPLSAPYTEEEVE